MSQTLANALQKGVTFRELLTRLNGLPEAGKPLALQVEARSVPYLDHVVVGWTDGPPTSAVAFVLSGAAPEGHAWRRFTLSRRGPWRYELECFPTPFHNPDDPLAPGIPPSQSRYA
jgi:hypothetical protein